MDKYIVTPPSGSTNNSIGAADRKWGKGYFEELPEWQDYLAESTGYGIISGCTPSIAGLVVSVASGTIHLYNGLRKSFPASSVTLTAADLTKPRTDLVYIDEDGVLQKETGTLGTAAVAGSNTYTITTNFANNDTIKLEGVTITATTGTQDSTHFVIGADVSESATNFALTINANTTLNATYTATASSGVVTVTETTAGGGNTPGVVTVTGTGAITNGTPTDSTPPISTPPATPANGIAVCTVAVAAGASTGTLKDTRDIKYNTDALREYVKTFRMASTVYSVSDIRYYPDLPVGWYLECTTAGTSASGDITLPTPLVENATITDGTVTWKARRISSADGVGVGIILPFAGNGAIPSGYLLCDGAAYSRTAFPDLFAAIGTDYGSGDGSTTFNVPDSNQAKRFLQGDVTAGTVKAAGLPNITGQAWNSNSSVGGPYFNIHQGAFANQAGATGAILSNPLGASSDPNAVLKFNASLSNPIYGNSDTVQPDALTTRFIIKAFDGQTADSALIDITQYANELAGKADRSLSNLTDAGKSFSFPSDTYVTLNNLTSYTAPTNGYLLCTISTAANSVAAEIKVNNVRVLYQGSYTTNLDTVNLLPVKKGDVITATSGLAWFTSFFYAQGEVPA